MEGGKIYMEGIGGRGINISGREDPGVLDIVKG